ncbi:unnamed protein product [Heterosigma akashiwo]
MVDYGSLECHDGNQIDPLVDGGSNASSIKPSTHVSKRFVLIALGIALGIAVGAVAYVDFTSFGHSKLATLDEVNKVGSSGSGGPSVTITISNEYPPLEDSVKMYGWQHIVEPYRTTTLTFEGANSKYMYTWSIVNAAQPSQQLEVEGNGNSEVSVVFTEAGRFYDINIEERDTHGASQYFKIQVICKYVRREIRTLNQEDRQKYFNALEAFHTLSQEDGQKLYGTTFYSHKELTVQHLETVGSCSPWHSGPNFITTHLAFVADLEKVLQAIEPTIAMPYWNYIQDSVEYGNAWSTESKVFSDAFFGAYQESGELRGRWGFTLPRVQSAEDRETAHNSYGYLTNYYNQDNHGTLHRSNRVCGWAFERIGLPDCAAEAAVLAATDSFADFWDPADVVLHEKLHPMLGGAWDCKLDAGEAMAQLQGEAQAQLALESMLLVAPSLWELAFVDGLYNSVGDLATSVSFEEARFTCTAFEWEEIESLAIQDVYDFLYDHTFLQKYKDKIEEIDLSLADIIELSENSNYAFTHVDDATNAFLLRTLLKIVCGPGGLSHMASPLSATADPLFAVAHSLFHRQWSYLRLTNPNWDATFEQNMDCYGHRATDILPWQGFQGEEGGALRPYTNQDLMEVFAPSNPALPFIHDSLDFSYCSGSY